MMYPPPSTTAIASDIFLSCHSLPLEENDADVAAADQIIVMVLAAVTKRNDSISTHGMALS